MSDESYERRPRRLIRPGDSYTKDEMVERETVIPDLEPEFMGEPWGESDHVPSRFRVLWNEARQTYIGAIDDDAI